MLTDIIIVPRSEVETIRLTGAPNPAWERLELKNLDNIKLSALLLELGDDDAAKSLMGEERLICCPGDDGPWIFVLPYTLIVLLSKLSAAEVAAVATRWAAHEELRLDGWNSADVETLLHMLIDFSHRANAGDRQLLLWMCL